MRMIRLVQFLGHLGQRQIGVPSADGALLQILTRFDRVYDLACQAIRSHVKLEQLIAGHLSGDFADYQQIVDQRRLLPPLDHLDPARCLVTLTGLTHLGSAKSRDQMHAASHPELLTDSARMFQIGLQGGKPEPGQIGAQPEWAFKGDGRSIVAPEQPLTQPAYAEDGGEEAEIAGLYVIADDGTPWRVGFSLGNEFSDHLLESRNYLYLAHSKLRQCSIGPELLIGDLPASVTGSVGIVRRRELVWTGSFQSGEQHMSHSIANLEHHHFKYDLFRRPGDVHVHFFGASSVSFGAKIRAQEGDVFQVDVPQFGRPLRNELKIDHTSPPIKVRDL
jgi:hypothetical protein